MVDVFDLLLLVDNAEHARVLAGIERRLKVTRDGLRRSAVGQKLL